MLSFGIRAAGPIANRIYVEVRYSKRILKGIVLVKSTSNQMTLLPQTSINCSISLMALVTFPLLVRTVARRIRNQNHTSLSGCRHKRNFCGIRRIGGSKNLGNLAKIVYSEEVLILKTRRNQM